MRRLRIVVIVLGVVLVLVVAAIVIAGFVFGLTMTTRPNGTEAIFPTVVSCSIQNGSCGITMRNQLTYSAEAVGCLFQNIYAVNGNNQSLTTVNVGTGVLSTQPKGPPLLTMIAVNSTATVYCTPSASVPIPTVGSQADGEVQFSNQSVMVQFLDAWQK